jgi:lipid A disaccharide synthetase
VLGRAVVPELFQDAVTGERLSTEALRLLGDSPAGRAQRSAFGEIAAQLGEAGVGGRAASLVLGVAASAR